MNATDEQDDPNQPVPTGGAEAVKSMQLFFIDNQHSFPADAVLAGDLVLWPDAGKYPGFTPVAAATHPAFDGQVVVQAGNRGLIVSFCAGARNGADIRKCMSAKGEAAPEQYRIAVDGLVQRVMLHRSGLEERNDVHPFALLQWMQKANPIEAAVIQKALTLLYAKPEAITYAGKTGPAEMLNRQEVHEQVEGMLDQLSDHTPAAPAVAAEPMP
jgi:hypothetical protein